MKKLAIEYTLGLIFVILIGYLAWFLVSYDFQSTESHEQTDNRLFHEAGPFLISVNITPVKPVVGENQITIVVKDLDEMPVTGATVRAVGEMPAMGAMPTMYAPADISETSPGNYVGTFDLPMVGEWPLGVDVETAEGDHVDLTFDMATGRHGLTLASATPAGDAAYHTCPMHPSVKSATPGTCPICGMDLVPVSKQEADSGGMMIDERRRQLIGLKTGEVFRESFVKEIRTVGEVVIDETKLHNISLKFQGWIGKLNADFVGKKVQRGETLFSVYSPDVFSAQEEYLETIKRSKRLGGQSETLIKTARQRLRLWDFSNAQIDQLEKRGKAWEYVPYLSPVSGTIISKHINAGSGVMPGQMLLQIADLSNVWIHSQLYEMDMPLVKTGVTAEITFNDQRDKTITGTVDFVYPTAKSSTRTAIARINLENESGLLKPASFVDVSIRVDMGERLLIPKEAVLFSGDKRIVFVDQDNGFITPVEIVTGVANELSIEVLSGLSEGQTVVTSGNFLLASESRLKSGASQW